MSVTVKRINPNIGAEILGADLRAPLEPADVAAIEKALVDHEVVVLKNQAIEVADQIRFGRYFGELTVHPFSPNMADHPEVIVLDNHKDNPPRLTDVWHSDETFREDPPLGTILRCRITPEIGGDTLFASMTCAYEGLSDRMQRHIDGLEAVHDFKPFRTLFPAGSPKLRDMEDKFPNPTHPVVRVHPVSGRRILNVNIQFTLRIVGMKESESRSLLEFLFSQVHIPDYQLRNRWEPDQMVFWDNRATQHYAVHDYWPQRRRMERVTVRGDKPFGVESAAAVGGENVAALRTEGLTAGTGEIAARNFER
jgi:taurine dioxygenase